MAVCRKHRQQGRTSCTCFISKRPLSDGYGGPDVSAFSESAFDALADTDYSSGSSYGSSSSYDSGSSSSSSSSYDSGSSSSSSSSYDSGSSSSSSDSGSW